MTTEFEGRADSAAERLKASMGLPERKVQSGPPPAPEGSYRAQAQDQLRAEDVQQQPEPTQPEPPQPQPQPSSENGAVPESVQKRFSELTRKVRDAESAAQAAEQRLQEREQAIEAERQRLEQVRQQQEQFLQEHLENLPPEEQFRLLQEQRTQQLLQEQEQRILGALGPQLESLHRKNQFRELMDIADRYPMFDYDRHAPLIEDFMRMNPACTVEMAYKAIAEPEDLGLPPRQSSMPKVVQPRGSTTVDAQQPAHEPEPEESLRTEARDLHSLARNAKTPEERRLHERKLQEHLLKRLGG